MNLMNPSTNSGPELQLPAPVGESAAYNPAAEQVVGQTLPLPERAPQVAERAPLPQPTAPAGGMLPAAPLAGPVPVAPPTAAVSTTTHVAVPATADDNDLIEKEWVAKAKQIVERTRHDPHQQSKELTVFKNDYLNKRYNKTLKISE